MPPRPCASVSHRVGVYGWGAFVPRKPPPLRKAFRVESIHKKIKIIPCAVPGQVGLGKRSNEPPTKSNPGAVPKKGRSFLFQTRKKMSLSTTHNSIKRQGKHQQANLRPSLWLPIAEMGRYAANPCADTEGRQQQDNIQEQRNFTNSIQSLPTTQVVAGHVTLEGKGAAGT